MFEVKILADSVNTAGNRLRTFCCTYPRIIHSELMTHRLFSRNAASSRAIPVEKILDMVMTNPFIPIHWGAAQKGMQAYAEVADKASCEREWLKARDHAVEQARRLLDLGLHKQVVNRILEPWMWITTIISTTSLKHFELLRAHEAAEPHFQKLARMMVSAAAYSDATLLFPGEWHLPFLRLTEGDSELSEENRLKVCTARCARVSYLTHDGRRDVEEDIKLHDRLLENGHWSPFEHVAQAAPGVQSGNFEGFVQYRKHFLGEFVRD